MNEIKSEFNSELTFINDSLISFLNFSIYGFKNLFSIL